MEREVGGGIGMGNTCKPMAVSFQCMTKFATKKKKNTGVGCHFLHPAENKLRYLFRACSSRVSHNHLCQR